MNAKVIVAILSAAIISGACSRGNSEDSNPVTLRLDMPAAPLTAAPSDTFRVGFSAHVARGWHVYSLTQGQGGPVRMTVTAGPHPFERAGEVIAPEPERRFDANFGIETESYADGAAFVVPVLVSEAAEPGTHNLEVRVRYQACSDRLCLPARTAVLRTPVRVGS